jgi:hypothetical protein
VDSRIDTSSVSAPSIAETTAPATRWDAFKAWAHDWWDDVVALNGVMLAGPDVDMSQWPPARPNTPDRQH